MSDDANPYRPPQSPLTEEATGYPLVPASRGRRLGTLLIDYVCFMAFSFCVGFLITFLFGQAGMDAIRAVPNFVFGCAVIAVYYVFFEGIWARTPGKLVFGTLVVTDTGEKPSIGQVLGRTVCRFIPFEAFSFFGEKGWHDSIPKTRVVRKQAL